MAEATVCLTYDFDAVSPWLWTYDLPSAHPQGVFGADVGVPRILDIHDRFDIPATWFVPGHTIESFPEASRDIHEAGHEIQHHGWKHVGRDEFDDREEERADFERAIASIEELTGETPIGFRNPPGAFSDHTVDILADLGFEWTSTMGASDHRPTYLRNDWQLQEDEPFDRGEPTDIVDVPFQWQRDDLLQVGPIISQPYGDEGGTRGYLETDRAVFDRLRDEFDWLYANAGDPVFVLLLHPQCSGRGNAIDHFEGLVQHMNSRQNVRFADVSTVAADFRQND